MRVMTGTILGGALGFYVMHRLETSHKVRSLHLPLPPVAFLPVRVSLPGGSSPRYCFFWCYVQAKMEERLRKYEAHMSMVAKGKEEAQQRLQDEAALQHKDQARLLPDS